MGGLRKMFFLGNGGRKTRVLDILGTWNKGAFLKLHPHSPTHQSYILAILSLNNFS